MNALFELENTEFRLSEQPFASLFSIYKKEFLDVSVSKGLINADSLALAGDGTPVYKNDFTIDKDGVPLCPSGYRMRRDGVETAKVQMKFKCPKISRKNGYISCTCETPCSDAKYGCTVHLVMNDNPRLFTNPPRSSKEWKREYNARTSAERSNKREKSDFKSEDGRHRSTKMWYCRPYHTLMLQHLDAWDLPPESPI